MNKSLKTPFVGCLCALMGFLLGVAIVLNVRRPSTKPVQPEPPDVAGAKVPARLFQIDFSRRYDIVCNNTQGDPLTTVIAASSASPGSGKLHRILITPAEATIWTIGSYSSLRTDERRTSHPRKSSPLKRPG
jgi:hypothetical protein